MADKKKRKKSREAQLARRKATAKERKHAAELDRLFTLGPGGSTRKPLVVATPALVNASAEALPCPRCGGRLRVSHDEIDRSTEALLRIAHASCQACGAPRKIWIRIQPPMAN